MNVALQVLAFLSERNAEAFKMRIPLVSLLVLIAVVGLAGNVLVVMVYSHKYRPCSTTVYILAIAGCDLFINVIAVPMEILSLYNAYTTSYWVCRGMFASTILSTESDALLLVPVAFDRFWKVWRPTQYRLTFRKSVLICVCTVLTACALYGPFIPLYGVYTMETGVPGIRANLCWIDDAYRGTAYYIAYKVVESLVFYVSLLTQVVLYFLIAVKLMQQRKNRQKRLASEGERSSKRGSKLSADVQGGKWNRVSAASITSYSRTPCLVLAEDNREQTRLAEQPASLSVPVDRETQGDTQPTERNGQEPRLATQAVSISVPRDTQGDMQPMERSGQEPHLPQQTVSLSVPVDRDTQGDTQPSERNGQEPHLAAQALSLSVPVYRDTQGDMQPREPTMSRVEEMKEDTRRGEPGAALVSMSGSSVAVNPNPTMSETGLWQTSSATMVQDNLCDVLLSRPLWSAQKDAPEGNVSRSNAAAASGESSTLTSASDQKQRVSPGAVSPGQAQHVPSMTLATQPSVGSDRNATDQQTAKEAKRASTLSVTQTPSFKRGQSLKSPTISYYSHRVKSKTTKMMLLLTLCYILNWMPHVVVRSALFHLGIIRIFLYILNARESPITIKLSMGL